MQAHAVGADERQTAFAGQFEDLVLGLAPSSVPVSAKPAVKSVTALTPYFTQSATMKGATFLGTAHTA